MLLMYRAGKKKKFPILTVKTGIEWKWWWIGMALLAALSSVSCPHNATANIIGPRTYNHLPRYRIGMNPSVLGHGSKNGNWLVDTGCTWYNHCIIMCQSESQGKVCTAIKNWHAKACQSMTAKTTINQSKVVKLFNWVLSTSYQKSQLLFLIISSRPSLRFWEITFSSLKKRFLSREQVEKNHHATVVMHATMVVHHKYESSFASPANDEMPATLHSSWYKATTSKTWLSSKKTWHATF